MLRNILGFLKVNLSIRNSFTDQRTKTFLRSTLYSYLGVVLSLVVSFFITPLLISSLGIERFGIWQTIFSVVSLATLLNFGMGNGLRNLITSLNLDSRNLKEGIIGDAIGGTIIKMIQIVLASILIFVPLIYFFFDPYVLFQNSNIFFSEIRICVIIFLILFLVSNIFGLSNSIAFGLQKSYLTSISRAVYMLISFITFYILDKYISINLIHTALIFGILQCGVYLFLGIYQNRKYKLNINFRQTYSLQKTTNLSKEFFVVQALALVFLSMDSFVISYFLGPQQTAEFSIVNKIFFALITFFSVLLIQYWNTIGEAYEQKDLNWIFSSLKGFSYVIIIVVFIGLIVAYFQQYIINFWIGENVFNILDSTFYLFVVYLFFHCINSVLVNIQNGLSQLKFQKYSVILSLFFYFMGCYFLDIKSYGYNMIIILKIGIMFFSVIINSSIIFVLRK